MSEPAPFGFYEAAQRLGVPLNVLRRAIREGRVPAPPQHGAVAAIPAAWLDSVDAALKDNPAALSRSLPQKVPAYARYDGTSAWRKYPVRVRQYAQHRATAGQDA
jgi:hypothetical protein